MRLQLSGIDQDFHRALQYSHSSAPIPPDWGFIIIYSHSVFAVFASRLRFALRHPFTRDSAILQVAGIISKVVGIATGILYANLLGPELFGLYALAVALAGFLNVFQEFGMSHAMVNLLARAEARGDQTEAQHVLAYFLKATVLIGATSGLAGMLSAPLLGKWWYGSTAVGWYASLGVLAFALTFFVPLVTTIQQVRRELIPLTVLETASKVLGATLTVALVVAGAGVLGVIVGQLLVTVGSSIAAAAMYRQYVRQGTVASIASLWRTAVPWAKIRYYFRFGFLIAISKNILKINQTVPLLIVGAVLPTTSGLGFFKVAFTYVGLPLVIADPVARLLNDQFPKTEVAGYRKLFKRFYQVTALTVAVHLVLLAPALALSPWVLTFLFPAYHSALPFVFALAPYPLLVASAVGFAAMFRTLNRMRANVVMQVLTLLAMLPLAWWLIRAQAILGLVVVTLLLTLVPVVMGFSYFWWLGRRLVPHVAEPALANE